MPEKRASVTSDFFSAVNSGWEYAEMAKKRNLKFRRACWPPHLHCYWCNKRETYLFCDGREVGLDCGYDEYDWEFLEIVPQDIFNDSK